MSAEPSSSDSFDALFARLALGRGWITPEDHERALDRLASLKRSGVVKSLEDILAEEQLLGEERLQVLRRLTSRLTQQVRIGDYHLLRRIGIGGTGVVFEARHRRLGRRVALKVLFPRLEKERGGYAERFLREARVLARIDDPRVVHPYDAGQDGEFHYIATEIVPGKDLGRIIESDGPAPLKRGLEILREVAGGLAAIHRAGLVHRDIKPGNILVSDEDGSIKIADLGLFFADFDRQVYWDGMVFGTPRYMSPEQIRGEQNLDGRADLYSLGATAYHLLTGEAPFTRESSREVVRAQLGEPPPRARELRPELPGELELLLLELLAKVPDERPPTAERVVERIEGILSRLEEPAVPPSGAPVPPRAEPVPSSPLPPASPAPPARRIPLPVIVAAAGSLAVGIGVGVWLGLAGLGEPPGEPVPPDSTATAERKRRDRERREAVVRSLEEVGDGLEGWWESLRGREAGGGEEPEADSLGRRVFREVIRGLGTPFERPEKIEPTPRKDTLSLPLPVITWSEGLALGLRIRVIARWNELADSGARLRIPGEGRPGGTDRPVVLLRSEGELLARIESERRPLSDLPLATWLAWGALGGEAEEHVVEGVALALTRNRLDLARWLAERLDPELPDLVLAILESAGKDESLPLGTEEYLEERLTPVLLQRNALAAHAAGRWTAARKLYGSLLEPGRHPLTYRGRPEVFRENLERVARQRDVSDRFFQVPVSHLDPLRDERFRIEYAFERWDQMRDFRIRTSAWEYRDGRLARTGRRSPETIDTVAVFELPVRIEGSWRPGRDEAARGRILLRFAHLCLGIGAGEEPLSIFLDDDEGQRRFWSGEPRAGAGDFVVEIFEDRVRAELPDGVSLDSEVALEVPRWGRVGVDLRPGAQLGKLRLIGTLEPTWLEARRAALGLTEALRGQ